MKEELLTAYKIWLIEKGLEDLNSLRNTDYYDLPYADEITWGLYDDECK